MDEVHQVVGQSTPQGDAACLLQSAHRDLRKPSIGSEVGVDGFAGGRPLLVDFFSLLASHAPLPSQQRRAVCAPGFQFATAPLRIASRFGRHEQRNSLGVGLLQIFAAQVSSFICSITSSPAIRSKSERGPNSDRASSTTRPSSSIHQRK